MLIPAIMLVKYSYGQIVINEFMGSNVSALVDTNDYLINSDWIELHNPDPFSVDIGGYFISDDLNDNNKWRIPDGLSIGPGEYLIFWADGKDKIPGETDEIYFTDTTIINIINHHLNFKLSSDGEEIALFDTAGNMVDSIVFGIQKGDIAFGRNPDNPETWVYLGEASPGALNSSVYSIIYDETTDPVLSIDGGFYAGTLYIEMSHASASSSIYYTLDGSTPNINSTLYTTPVEITYTRILKARAYETGKLPGHIITHSFFIDEQIDLPVISISSEYHNLWSYDFGIFQNSLKNREISISIEFFDEMGDSQFNVNAGMKLFGSTIYQLRQKPMSVSMKNKYGNDLIEEQVFQDKDIHSFQNLVLRNGGNDNGISFFRDAMITSLVAGKMDIDYQAFKPSVVFVNGEYWGIYNLREKMNEKYLASNHHVRHDNLDMLENNAEIMEGNAEDYLTLLNYIENNDISDPAVYEYLKAQIDLSEYINYKIIKTYMGYWLADINNKYWKIKDEDGKWRWLLFDLEHSFGRHGSDACNVNTLEKISSNYEGLPEWSTLLFRKLCDNQEFRSEFTQRFASLLNTALKPETVISVIDSLQDLYATQMPRHIARWDSDPLAIPSIPSWNTNIEDMRDYARCRRYEVQQHLLKRFGIADTFRVSIKIPASDTGKVFINDVLITDSIFSGLYFSDMPVRFKAAPMQGFQCLGWEGITVNSTLDLILYSDTILKPVFEADSSQNILPTHISQDTVLTQLYSPYTAYGDIIIDSNITMTIEAGVEILMSDKANIIVYGKLTSNGALSSAVSIRSNPESYARVPYFNTQPRWGAICFQNASDSSRLSNIEIHNTSHGFIPEIHKATISAYNSVLIIDNATITDAHHPVYTEYGSTILRNCALSTQLSGDIINIKYANSAIIENCILKGNYAEDTDAIDLDRIDNGIIRGNKIYSFFGSNSDGIDLGENCDDVLIYENTIYDCSDKGISIGQASMAVIKRNLIANCNQGIGIKDSSSFAYIDQNTFNNNAYSIACFEKNPGKGGGSASVNNSILANSSVNSFLLDKHSSIDIQYSLANTTEISGSGNVYAEPGFVNAGINNFELRHNSPCINSGNPDSPPDPDNSRADMGAYFSFSGLLENQVIINEINYKSAPHLFSGDWIELYNPGNSDIDLTNWLLMDKNLLNKYYFPSGTILGSNDFLCVCNNDLAFSQQFPGMDKYIADFKFNLDANEQIKLFDANMNLINALSYQAYSPWPAQSNGNGSSLELTSPELDNTVPSNWHESYVIKGTPGFPNSTPTQAIGLYINEFMAGNTISYTDNYNQYDDWIELYNGSNSPINIAGLYLSDNFDNPTQWQIPNEYQDSTTIGPKDFLVLWADDSTAQGILHLNFKLALQGEQIALVQIIGQDTIFVDSVSYRLQNVNIPFGRYPDAGPLWHEMYPTPDSSNILQKEFTKENIKIYPNPAHEYFYVDISNVLNENVTITIINVQGQEILNEILNYKIDSNIHMIKVKGLSRGLYFVRVQINKLSRTGKLIII